jgi:hypothetical protein
MSCSATESHASLGWQPCRLGEEGREMEEQLAHDITKCGRDGLSQWLG